jgi:hypothetical protein
MAQTNDILLDINGDLPILTGFFFGDSGEQHMKDIVVSFPGEWKQSLSVGVGIRSYVRARVNQLSLQKIITSQFQRDKFSVSMVTVANAGDILSIKVKASR